MTNQTFYKIRSLDNWKFVTDIIVNSRLFAAPFESLNDPMEGRYHYFGDTVSKAYQKAVYKSKLRKRICSLSRKFDSTLLWSYYAGGHTGVAFGVSFPERTRAGQTFEMRDVTYDHGVSIGNREAGLKPDQVALKILTQKQTPWSHETETRVFTSESFVPVVIKELILGVRISAQDANLIKALTLKWHPDVKISKVTMTTLDHPEAVKTRDKRRRPVTERPG
jgi:hypothetical protein